ncbi:hypothetical protein Btru_074957 [Bulinus truncatus]|nr:hypothetical protein Btru_074957 [Bulinus truncatus]
MLSALLALTLFLSIIDRERTMVLSMAIELKKDYSTDLPQKGSTGWTEEVRSSGHEGRFPVTKDKFGSLGPSGDAVGEDVYRSSGLNDVLSSRGVTFLNHIRDKPRVKQNLLNVPLHGEKFSLLISEIGEISSVHYGGSSNLFRKTLSTDRMDTKFPPSDQTVSDSAPRQFTKRDSSAILADCGPLTSSRCQLMPARTCMTVCVEGYNVRVCRRRNGCSIMRH